MIKIVVTGSECTGKTTLARSLAEAHGVPWSAEYCRAYVEQGCSPLGAEDVEPIARGQVSAEDEAIARAAGLVVLDTDLLSTVVYSHHYYGACPEWIESALCRRAGDLYLLCGIDVPWRPDGLQRDRSRARPEMQRLFRNQLIARRLDFIELRGAHDVRLKLALEAVDRLLGRAPDHPKG